MPKLTYFILHCGHRGEEIAADVSVIVPITPSFRGGEDRYVGRLNNRDHLHLQRREGFTRTIVSLNECLLVRIGSAGGEGNVIPYFVEATGSEALDFLRTQFAQPQTRTYSGSIAALNGVSGTLTVFVNGVHDGGTTSDPAARTTVFAAQYTEVLTLAVTAN